MKHFYARHFVDLRKHFLECNCGWSTYCYGATGTQQKTYEDAKRDLSIHIYEHRER